LRVDPQSRSRAYPHSSLLICAYSVNRRMGKKKPFEPNSLTKTRLAASIQPCALTRQLSRIPNISNRDLWASVVCF
ncbi:fdhD/NarQ family protein, partial [Vibrio parahaemolyticus AQ3810]